MKILFFENKFFSNARGGKDISQNSSFQHERGVAFANEGVFLASGLNNGGEIYFVRAPGKNFSDLKDWVEKNFGDSEPVESDYVLGTFYKRIWRPVACGDRWQDEAVREKVNESFVSLRILLAKLETLFETIEPNEDNLHVYGHKVREVILLACMEVESAWTAVLKENGQTKKRFTTHDYVRLLNPMLLDAYELTLQSYPNFPKFIPFAKWDPSCPTTSLSWYDAYNKTKHDREDNLKFATLENAVHAVGAVVVMLHAQFGLNLDTGPFGQKNSAIRNIFKIVTDGFERYEKSFYISKFKILSDSGKPSPLVQPKDWTALSYPF